MTLFNPSLSFEIIKSDIDTDGRFVISDIKINNHIYTIINIYGSNIDNPVFYSNFVYKMGVFDCDRIIFYFNFVFNFELDKKMGFVTQISKLVTSVKI